MTDFTRKIKFSPVIFIIDENKSASQNRTLFMLEVYTPYTVL